MEYDAGLWVRSSAALRAPSAIRLRESMPYLSDEDIDKLRSLIHQCVRPERTMKAIDRLLGNYGVEHIPVTRGGGNGLLYSNTGESYATTILYDMDSHAFRLSSWGDVVERDRRFRSCED